MTAAVSPADAIARLARGEITVIDVREVGEVLASGQAEGALHLPLATLAASVAQIDKSKPVAVYCAAGVRADRAVESLQALGFDAHNIGGFGDWTSNGGPVRR